MRVSEQMLIKTNEVDGRPDLSDLYRKKRRQARRDRKLSDKCTRRTSK